MPEWDGAAIWSGHAQVAVDTPAAQADRTSAL